MPSTKSIIVTISFGLVMIALTAMMGATFPQRAELSEGYRNPIIAFEFARSEADVAFLQGDSDIAKSNRAGMVNGHQWDMIFPFAYAGFLFMLALQFYTQRRMHISALLLSTLIVPLDINENLVLLEIVEQARLGSFTDSVFSTLYVATWLKWGTISLVVALLAIAYANSKRWLFFTISMAYVSASVLALLLNSPAILVELMALFLSVFFLFAFIHQGVMLFNSRARIKASR